MADIDKIKSQVNRCLCYDYPGNPDDGDGFNDRRWINKNQKYEVAYAIAKCLSDCEAAFLAADTAFIRSLEKMIQDMDHDGMGRCKRENAYHTLKTCIIVTKHLKT